MILATKSESCGGGGGGGAGVVGGGGGGLVGRGVGAGVGAGSGFLGLARICTKPSCTERSSVYPSGPA